MISSSNRNIFRVTGPLCGEFTGHLWILCTKASDAELWCFLWSAPGCSVNNRVAGDLRRHRAHYDVTLLFQLDPTMMATVNIPIALGKQNSFEWSVFEVSTYFWVTTYAEVTAGDETYPWEATDTWSIMNNNWGFSEDPKFRILCARMSGSWDGLAARNKPMLSDNVFWVQLRNGA